MNITIRPVLVLSVFLLLYGSGDAWAQRKKREKKPKGVKELGGKTEMGRQNSVSDKDLVSSEYVFVEGMKHFILDEYQAALEKFKESIKLNPQNAATYYQAAYTYCKLENFEEAIRYSEKSLQLEKTNPFYYRLLAQIHQQFMQYDKAAGIYEDLIKNVPGQEDYYIDLASLYMQLDKPKSAIAAFEKAESIYGINESIVRQKQKIYLNLNNLPAAINEGERLVAAFPDESYYLVSQAKLLILNNKIDEAAKLLASKKADFPKDGEISLLLADIARRKGDKKAYQENLLESFQSGDLDISIKIRAVSEHLNYAQGEEEQKTALEMGKMLAEQYPDDENANALYADLLLADQNIKGARTYYVKSAGINGNNFNVWDKIIRIDSDLNEVDSIIKHSEMALEYFPNQAIFWFYNGTGWLINKDYTEAVTALEHGRMISKDEVILSQFQAQLGDAYNQVKEYEKSDAAYEYVLSKDSDNLHVINNYSYYLSLRKTKLKRAKELSKKLIEKEPENATFLDTYGWVLFVAGDYEEALPILQKAHEIDRENATITEHYGDVLFKTGKTEQAVTVWKKAQERGGDDPKKLGNKIETKSMID